MRILKYVFLLLLLLFIALTVFIATQEGTYDIKEERVIKVPETVLYNYINDYRNWENVGILTNNDTTAVFSYSGSTFGNGAKTSWKVGGSEGKLQTVKAIENDTIIQKAVIDGQPSDIAWAFKDTVGGTRVSVRIKGQLSFTDKAYAVLRGGVQEKLEATLDKGLANLNTFLVHELGTYNVEVKGLVNKGGVFYLKQSATTTIAEVNKRTAEMLTSLMEFVVENKIAVNGAPFTLYKTFDKVADKAEYSVCIPIKEEIFTTPGSEFEGGKLEPFTALKTTLKGDYSHLKKAWDASDKYIAEKSLQENTTGDYLEVYTRSIKQTKKPSGWITDIYAPIGQPAAPATDVLPVPHTSASTPTGTRSTSGITPAATAPVTRPAGTQPKPKPAVARPVTTTPATKPTPGTAQPARTTPATVPN